MNSSVSRAEWHHVLGEEEAKGLAEQSLSLLPAPWAPEAPGIFLSRTSRCAQGPSDF